MSSDKKPKSLEDLWDRSRQKLLVYVIEGVSLLTKSGAGNPYVKIFIDKQKFKTQALKHSEDPVWKELFLFEFNAEQLLSEGAQLEIEVYNKQSIGADKLIGIAKYAIPTQASNEEVVDTWIDLQLPPNMKEKNKELLDGKLGNIHLRLLFSNAKETPVSPPGNNQISSFHLTKEIKSKMKSGDILLYSGIGPLDACLKTLTNTKYSRVALVFRELNKWTQKEQLFLFEVTRNVGGFPDAFSERCAGGANVFRLEERLHQLSAKSVWWAPLKERLDPESGEPNMVDWLWEVHEGRQQIADFVAPIPSEIITMFASQFEFNVVKQQFAVAELNSTQFLINALRLGGRRLPFSGAKEFVAPVALLGLNYFDDPVVLRQRRDDVDAATLEAVLSGPTVANDREAAIAAANAVVAGSVAATAVATATPEKGAFAPPTAGAGRETHRMTMLSSADPKRSTSAVTLNVSPQTLAAAGAAAPEKENNAFERKDSGPVTPTAAAEPAAAPAESAPAPAPAELAVAAAAAAAAEKRASTNPFDDEPVKKEEPKSPSTNPFDEAPKKDDSSKDAAGKPQPPPKKKKSTKVTSPTITPANASTSTAAAHSTVPIAEPLPAEAVAAISPAPAAEPTPAPAPAAQPEPVAAAAAAAAAPASAEPVEAKPTTPRAETEKAPEPATPTAQTEPAAAPPAAADGAAAAVASPPKVPKKPKESKTMRGEGKDKPKKDKSGVQRKATHGTDKPKKVAKKPETSSNRLSVKVSGGIMPQKFEERSYAAKLIFDFEAENEGELSAKKGEVVRVLDDLSDPDWALVRKLDLSSDYGCVPKTYLKKVVDQPAQ